jgi:hypothetical protein
MRFTATKGLRRRAGPDSLSQTQLPSTFQQGELEDVVPSTEDYRPAKRARTAFGEDDSRAGEDIVGEEFGPEALEDIARSGERNIVVVSFKVYKVSIKQKLRVRSFVDLSRTI